MKKILFILLITVSYNFGIAQKYQFKPVVDLYTSPVKNQGRTGTCWSFSSSSFIESEIERISGKKIDVSEMYTVRTTYDKKAYNYVMRQGTAQFDEGGLAHDLMKALKRDGLVPQEAFTGLFGQTSYDHSKIVPEVKNILNRYIRRDSTLTDWKTPVKKIFDKSIGAYITTFTYKGKTYTPKAFLKMTGLNPDDYITFTSFTHHPYYSSFILEIPDNFSNGSFYNLPLNEYMQLIDHALKNGYTVELDTDSSEPTFSQKNGVAVLPEKKEDYTRSLTEIVKEVSVTPENRQKAFENYSTTDDHLMHITGIYKDQKGNKYYKVKNSWGTNAGNGGFINISEAFMRMKSISVMIHKDAVPKKYKDNLRI